MKPVRSRIRAGPLAVAAVAVLASACGAGGPGTVAPGGPAPAPGPSRPAPPVPRHAGVNLRVLVLSDGTEAVRAIRHELAGEGVPATVVRLRAAGRPAITKGFLTRRAPGGGRGGNFAGIVAPVPTRTTCPVPSRPPWPGTSGGSGSARSTPTHRPHQTWA